MPVDPGYQAQPPTPKRPVRREPFGPIDAPADVHLHRPSGTGDQFFMIALLEALVLIAVLAAMLVFAPDHASLLWTHPLGIKLSLGAAVLLIINLGALLGTAAFLNRRAAASRNGPRLALVVVLGLLFYVPVLFVVLVGPFVIVIVENLR